jgi:Ser/Thr protein kinase RdoA (MazF antagonist)
VNEIVETALSLWGLTGAHYHLVAARENAVYEITTDTQKFALRLHRKGYRTDAELRSELTWMNTVAQGGIVVPKPIASRSCDFLHTVDGVQVDVLTWLTGSPIGATGKTLNVPDRGRLFHQIGQALARLHDVSDIWTPPTGFTRCAWDRDGLMGDDPLWGRFWENPSLSAKDHMLFTSFRQSADAALAKAENQLDYGLIHADLVRENMLQDGDKIQLIDFDDGGFGFRLFDIATALLKNLDEPDFPDLKASLLKGYTSVRPIDVHLLDLFMALRSATYVGWIITRMDENGSHQRNIRFIKTTRRLVENYMAG